MQAPSGAQRCRASVLMSKEDAVSMRWLVALMGVGLFVLPAYAADEIAESVAKLNLTQEQLVELGDFVFNTEGANTCLKCHGKGGHGGDQAGAADLRHPRTWRSYQALGGDEAFTANKEEFLDKMETSLHYLINKGATTWNQRFSKQHSDINYDWSKVEPKTDKYDSMMKGTTTGPMKNRIRELQKKLADMGHKVKPNEAQDVASVAAFEYVKTFDDGSEKGGVFKSN
jgi:hypothetical protein